MNADRLANLQELIATIEGWLQSMPSDEASIAAMKGNVRTTVEFLGRGEGAGRVVGQQGRDLQRHPAVHAVGLVVDRPKQIGGLPEVLQRQREEQRLARLAFLQFPADGVVVVVTVLDGVS
jgi:hypothetical protein